MDFYESVVVLQGIFRDLGSLMRVRGLKSAAYSALSVGILGAGTAYVIAPQESLHNVLPYARGPEAVMLWRSLGAALLMLPTWTYNLKAHQTCHLPVHCLLHRSLVRSLWSSGTRK